MGNTIKALRRGLKAGIEAAQNHKANQFQAAGKTIVCPVCGNDGFALIGVAGISIAGYGIECSKCTHILYFRNKPRQLP